MSFIIIAMLGMIVGSIIVEVVLPQGLKDRLGGWICWGMMGFTMAFLAFSTVALLIATWFRYIEPAISA